VWTSLYSPPSRPVMQDFLSYSPGPPRVFRLGYRGWHGRAEEVAPLMREQRRVEAPCAPTGTTWGYWARRVAEPMNIRWRIAFHDSRPDRLEHQTEDVKVGRETRPNTAAYPKSKANHKVHPKS
jgi:hypothetical protein